MCRAGALQMQRVVRGHLGRKMAQRLRFLYTNARTIQCWVRCLIAWRIAGDRYEERAMLNYFEDKTPFGLLRELHRRRERSKKKAANFVTNMHSAYEAAERREAIEKIPVEDLLLDPSLIGVSRRGPEERLAEGLKSPYAMPLWKRGKSGRRTSKTSAESSAGFGEDQARSQPEGEGVRAQDDGTEAGGIAQLEEKVQREANTNAVEETPRGETAEMLLDSVALPLPPPGWKKRISMQLEQRLKARENVGEEMPAAEAALQENKLRDFGSFGGNFSNGRGISTFEMIEQ